MWQHSTRYRAAALDPKFVRICAAAGALRPAITKSSVRALVFNYIGYHADCAARAIRAYPCAPAKPGQTRCALPASAAMYIGPWQELQLSRMHQLQQLQRQWAARLAAQPRASDRDPGRSGELPSESQYISSSTMDALVSQLLTNRPRVYRLVPGERLAHSPRLAEQTSGHHARAGVPDTRIPRRHAGTNQPQPVRAYAAPIARQPGHGGAVPPCSGTLAAVRRAGAAVLQSGSDRATQRRRPHSHKARPAARTYTPASVRSAPDANRASPRDEMRAARAHLPAWASQLSEPQQSGATSARFVPRQPARSKPSDAAQRAGTQALAQGASQSSPRAPSLQPAPGNTRLEDIRRMAAMYRSPASRSSPSTPTTAENSSPPTLDTAAPAPPAPTQSETRDAIPFAEAAQMLALLEWQAARQDALSQQLAQQAQQQAQLSEQLAAMRGMSGGMPAEHSPRSHAASVPAAASSPSSSDRQPMTDVHSPLRVLQRAASAAAPAIFTDSRSPSSHSRPALQTASPPAAAATSPRASETHTPVLPNQPAASTTAAASAVVATIAPGLGTASVAQQAAAQASTSPSPRQMLQPAELPASSLVHDIDSLMAMFQPESVGGAQDASVPTAASTTPAPAPAPAPPAAGTLPPEDEVDALLAWLDEGADL